MDNFLNTSGTSFYFVEPGLNLEMNLRKDIRLVTGLSYRSAFGLDEDSPHVSKTQVTNDELGGFDLNIGLKIGMY